MRPNGTASSIRRARPRNRAASNSNRRWRWVICRKRRSRTTILRRRINDYKGNPRFPPINPAMQSSDLPTFQTDLFVPRYRPIRLGQWELRVSEMNLVPGYWSGAVLVQRMAALQRGTQTWMSMTPYEIESQEIGGRLSRGEVLICGLGI